MSGRRISDPLSVLEVRLSSPAELQKSFVTFMSVKNKLMKNKMGFVWCVKNKIVQL